MTILTVSKTKLAWLQVLTMLLMVVCTYMAAYFAVQLTAFGIVSFVLWSVHAALWFWKTVELQNKLDS